MHYKYLPFPLLSLLMSLIIDGAISWFHWRAVTDMTCVHTIYTWRNNLIILKVIIKSTKKTSMKIQISRYLNHFCFFSLFEENSFFGYRCLIELNYEIARDVYLFISWQEIYKYKGMRSFYVNKTTELSFIY